MPPAVVLRSAVALSGRFPLLAGVDLEVDRGEVVALEGANGAGKTSLLRLCAGLVALSAGTGVVLGHDLRSEASRVRRRVGLLGHGTALYDELSATENLRFALRAARAGTAELAPALDRVGLVGRVGRLPLSRLSAGQRRRAALAVLIDRRPELWLLDEPHAALDAPGRALVDAAVLEAAAAGATVLLSSHDSAQAVALADRVVTISGGRSSGERPGRRPAVAIGARQESEPSTGRRVEVPDRVPELLGGGSVA